MHEVGVDVTGTEQDFASKVPMQVFWRDNDSSAQVIDRFIETNRTAFAARATELRKDPHPQSIRMAEYFERLAKKGKPILLSMGVTAKSDMLRLVSEEPDVYAVVMDPSPDTVRRLDEMRDKMPGRTAIQDVTDL